MGRIALAFKLFFKALGNRQFAQRVRTVLEPAPAALPQEAPAAAQPKPRPARSDAVNLLSVLQREARFIDFLKEDLSAYSDAQIGAAVRDVHRDCAAVVERLFAIRPLRADSEGATISVPAGFDASRLRLTGNVAGAGPYRGTLRHAGWQATKVDLPEWSGSEDSANVVAPAEVEVA